MCLLQFGSLLGSGRSAEKMDHLGGKIHEFLQQRLDDAPGMAGRECPGEPVDVLAERGKCSYTGVTGTAADGADITQFFGDNVDMKQFRWHLAEEPDIAIDLP